MAEEGLMSPSLPSTSGRGVAATVLAVGALSSLTVNVVSNGERLTWAILIAAGCAIAVIVGLITSKGRVLHPAVLPFGYVAAVLVVPVLYVLVAQRPLGLLTVDDVNGRVVIATGVFVGALMCGIALPTGRSKRISDVAVRWALVAFAGRSILLVTALMAAITTRLRGPVYGQGQLDYDFGASLVTIQNGLITVGVSLACLASVHLRRRVLSPADATLFAITAALTLLTGQRSPLVAPVLLLVYMQHTHVRRLRRPSAVLAALVLMSIFVQVGQVRSDARSEESPPLIEEVIRPLSSPTLTLHRTLEAVPRDTVDYDYGETYLAAAVRQLPGVVATRLLGPPTDTGAYRYREITRDFNPNNGFSFSVPAEAYLNFGWLGLAIVPLVLGYALSRAWEAARAPATRVSHLAYPLIITSLPYALRSDALTQVKLVLYPALMIAAILRISRLPNRGGDAIATTRPIGQDSVRVTSQT